eukprot:7719278-Pyramimonas_sp.AAC.1
MRLRRRRKDSGGPVDPAPAGWRTRFGLPRTDLCHWAHLGEPRHPAALRPAPAFDAEQVYTSPS